MPIVRQRVQRRAAAVALIALPFFWTGARAQAAAPLRPTPAQAEGPFYPVEYPRDADADLLRNGALSYQHGQPAWLEGRVLDVQGRPLRGAAVEIWQCDHAGRYHHPGDGAAADAAFQGFGRASVDTEGRYRFRTIRPAAYPGRTPHIHFKVKLGTRTLLTSQLYVAGEAGNTRDFLWRRLDGDAARAALTVPFEPAPDGLRAQFQIVVAGA